MKIVRLGTHISGLLFVNAKLSRKMPGGIVKDIGPFTFAVDTASERSFLCRYHQDILEKVVGSIHQHAQQIQALTLYGPLKYWKMSGYSVVLEASDGTLLSLNSENGEICFADDTLKGEMSAEIARKPDNKKTSKSDEKKIIFSVLGRDILRHGCLIVPKGSTADGVLVFDQVEWQKIPEAIAGFEPVLPIRVADTRPEDINWR